ncbi:protein of unknown function [Hyphomicrobium sp. 1Nfss2.1]
MPLDFGPAAFSCAQQSRHATTASAARASHIPITLPI